MKRPSFQFYPGDWLNDLGLRACSPAARGLWIDLICLMHQGYPYGYLTLPNKDNQNTAVQMIDNRMIARLAGLDYRTAAALLRELEAKMVLSKTEDGIIYSRRMVRDEKLRQIRAASGVMGGNPALLGKNLDNQNSTSGLSKKDNQIPTPSSSSSSSSSKPNTKQGASAFALPDWIPVNEWNAFMEQRTKLRKTPTEKAKQLLVKKLQALGGDTKAILEQSIVNGWQDVFPLRRQHGKTEQDVLDIIGKAIS